MIGTKLTLALSSVAKDRRIYIPISPMIETHPIAKTIGLPAAEMLQRSFGGCLMPYPVATVRLRMRDREIARDWMTGESIREVARRHKVHERTAMRSLTRVKTSDLNWDASPR